MDAFIRHVGTAAALMRENIDTDAIISAQVMVGGQVSEPGKVLFTRWRYRLDGSENGEFVLNQSRFRAATILVSAANFGCGSSREHAVWALTDYGIRCVIAPSFGEIFYDNAFQNGLLLASVAAGDSERVAAALEQAEAPVLEVDLEQRLITLPGGTTVAFDVPDERRQSLLRGLDELDLLLNRSDRQMAWASADRDNRPWIYLSRGRREGAESDRSVEAAAATRHSTSDIVSNACTAACRLK